MHKLDPIERLPDGTLFRLTPGQLRSVRGLAKRCCNFSGGDCLLLDGACPQYISRSLICRWFRRAVLPQQPKLEQAILSPKRLRRCAVCGTGILACSGRTKYCPACAKNIHRQQKAKSARNRHGRRQFRGETPLNGKPSHIAEIVWQYDFPRSPQIVFYLST